MNINSKHIGNKAANIEAITNSLITNALPFKIPRYCLLPTHFYEHYIATGEFHPKLLLIVHKFIALVKEPFIVRSSSPCEDMKSASFAGIYDSFGNLSGAEVLDAIKKVWDSNNSLRAEDYRQKRNISKEPMGVILQEYIKADLSGVLFTRHPNDPDLGPITYLNFIEGDCEQLVNGSKNGRCIYFDKVPNLDFLPKNRAKLLSLLGLLLEKELGYPVDIEWGFKKSTLYLFQVRPISDTPSFEKKRSNKKNAILRGTAVSGPLVVGQIQILNSPTDPFTPGNILVCQTTSPIWEPVMSKAKGLITDHGARTSHAALVAKELGIPAIVGTLKATTKLIEKEAVEIDAQGKDVGFVYRGDY